MLSDLKIKKANAKDRVYKMFDSDGLFLLVHPNGSKYWKLQYYFNKKPHIISLGKYPLVTLTDAREKRHDLRKMILTGIDPRDDLRQRKLQQQVKAADTFQAVAEDWLEKKSGKWSPKHRKKIESRMRLHIYPRIGALSLARITSLDVIDLVRVVEDQGHTEMSHRLLQYCSSVFVYGLVLGKVIHNPAAGLSEVLKPHQAENYPTLNEDELSEFLEAVLEVGAPEHYKQALRLLALTFVRPGELRKIRRSDIDLDKKLLTIPKENMKMRREHLVPLSTQAIRLIQSIRTEGNYLFPPVQPRKNPYMSDAAMNNIINDAGYKGRIVGHGFRHLASTVLNEHGFNADHIERQLAHIDENKVRATYNKAEYLDDRLKMMQWWGDFLEKKGL